MDNLSGEAGAKRHAPATARNREAIADVLAAQLPEKGMVLEVASGSGEHAIYFAAKFPQIQWQPSDREEDALASIAAYRAEAGLDNVLEPILLDASAPGQPAEQVDAMTDAVLCINMAHISPWEATIGLFAKAAACLGAGAPLILYGPYLEAGVETAPSNLQFDASLKARDPRWGLRDLADMDALAADNHFKRSARIAMPANNLALVYRKAKIS